MHIVWACGIFLCYFQLHFHSSNSKLELRDASSILWCGIVLFAPHCTESSMLPLPLSCYLLWQSRLFMCLCAVQFSNTPCTPLPAPYLLYSLYSLHSPGTLQLSNLCLLLGITATVTAIVWPFVCLFNSPTMPLFHGMVQYPCYIQHIATYYTFMRTCEACFVFKKTPNLFVKRIDLLVYGIRT